MRTFSRGSRTALRGRRLGGRLVTAISSRSAAALSGAAKALALGAAAFFSVESSALACWPWRPSSTFFLAAGAAPFWARLAGSRLGGRPRLRPSPQPLVNLLDLHQVGDGTRRTPRFCPVSVADDGRRRSASDRGCAACRAGSASRR